MVMGGELTKEPCGRDADFIASVLGRARAPLCKLCTCEGGILWKAGEDGEKRPYWDSKVALFQCVSVGKATGKKCSGRRWHFEEGQLLTTEEVPAIRESR